MNTAGRLLSTFNRLLAHKLGHEASMLKVWEHVFELSSDDPHLEDAVVMCLQATRSEIEVLRTRLISLQIPEDLMHPGLERLKTYTSTSYLNQMWNGFREDAMKPENRLSFKWADWVLRDEKEGEMPTEELAALRSELHDLEKSLRESDITAHLKTFIQRQIDTIRSALRLYRVQGVKPIEQALESIGGAFKFGEGKLHADIHTSPASTKALMQQTYVVIRHTAELADSINKNSIGSGGTYTLTERVNPLLLSLDSN